ncbi:MAG: TatD family hydrolase [Desulfovibrio sp.]|nr:TatD family hydrolase [Desulfovibrio sp.]
MSGKEKSVAPAPSLPRTGVDVHAHLDDPRFKDDLQAVLERAFAVGLAQIVQVFLSPSAWAGGKAAFDPYAQVYFTLGIHPTEAQNYGAGTESEIKEAIAHDSRIRALGEIGLDYYWKKCLPATQKEVFVKQLRLARSLDLPVVIHCREAEADALDILETEGFRNRPLLWHCFGGETTLAERIVARGWHISVPGPVTFPANRALRAAIADVPAGCLCTETDAPYLSPQPFRGKRNEPANTAYVVEAMAEARGVPAGELWTVCGDNARRFFGIE